MIVIRDDFDLDDIPYVMRKKSHVIIENGKMTKNRFIGEMPEFAPSICETEDEFIIRVPKNGN